MARTIEFDRDIVLEKAMNIFWQKGYSMTSIPNLVDATSLNPGSIYGAFDSKEGLFLETLEFYGKRSVTKLKQHLSDANNIVSGIETFLKSVVENYNNDNKGSCLVVNTLLEMSSHNDKIKFMANKQLETIETEILSALQLAKEQGELPSSASPDSLAKYIMVAIWGLRVMAKTNPDKHDSQAVLDQILFTLKNGH